MVLTPDVTLNQGRYQWAAFSPEQTGMHLVTLTDPETGVKLASVHPNTEKRTAAHMAWAGARHSRAPGDTEDIMHEMGERGVDPDEKLDQTFTGYGHASVGDMARFKIDFNSVPMHVPLALFNWGIINSGQEKSTRYQSGFKGAILHPLAHYVGDEVPAEALVSLEVRYQALGMLAQRVFNNNLPLFKAAYTEHFKPESGRERSALTSRSLDTARFALLLGQNTGFSFETSARDYSRMIGHLRASEVGFYRGLGEQLETLLTPEAETFLFLAARAEFMDKKVAPRLAQGITVVADRLADSTRAYQGGGHYRSDPGQINAITRMNDFALRGKWPDVTFLLDISHAEMLKRGRAAGTKLDYMESLGPEFFERVIAEYRDLAATHPERVKLIDGTLPPQVIFDEHIKPHIEALYRE